MRWKFPAATAVGLAVWAAVAATAGTVSLTAPPTANPGDTVTVSVRLSPDLTGVYALQGGFSYDPAVLSPLPAESGAQGYYAGALNPFPGESIPLDADLQRLNFSTPGRVLFGYVKNPSNPSASPSIVIPEVAVWVTFQVGSEARGTTHVAWTPYNVSGHALPAVMVGGADGAPMDAEPGLPLPIAITLAGDANADGVVNLADVALVMKSMSGLTIDESGPVMENADVWPAAPDGQLTLEDAVSIARMAGAA